MGDISNSGCYHVFMKPDLRISIKDYRCTNSVLA
jgi:hypothetical protein